MGYAHLLGRNARTIWMNDVYALAFQRFELVNPFP